MRMTVLSSVYSFRQVAYADTWKYSQTCV